MKAIFFEEHGGPEVLKYAELPDPEAAAGEAIVKVKAVALNHLDIWVRQGWKGLNLQMPHISGSDISGEIVSVNAPNSQFAVGTRVIVNPGICTADDQWTRRGEDSVSPGYKLLGEQKRGGMAEYVVVPVSALYKIPEEIDFINAAAPILVGMTCWRMLFARAHLKVGESVLIIGAGGGVNSHSILFAKAAGATVYALTSSREKTTKALELGADEVINYKKSPEWALDVMKLTKGRGVDVVVDNVGASTLPQSLRAVARGGRIVTVGNTSGHKVTYDNRLMFTKQVSLIGSTMGSRQDFMDAMQFMWSKGLKPVVDRVEPLKEGINMLQYLERGEQFGKVVLSV
ncbi:MAG: zinc-binding dehydrogenase [bacterium]|nr:zinc-binding dehydrogenase [bacterium]